MLPMMHRKMLIDNLDGNVELFSSLAQQAIEAGELDRRPDPERFSLREIFAHVADFDPIFLGRIVDARDKDNPTLVGSDPGRMAIDNNYSHSVPNVAIDWLRASRPELTAALRELTDDEWSRTADHKVFGPMTIETLAIAVSIHDGYHLNQILEWLKS
ncbi:MAG TPA: DinB family protein [Capsulimonadaceae bacterium]|jgi:uncharacterized damage-inducible protein DinB